MSDDPLPSTFQGRALEAADWARAAGYACRNVDLSDRFPPALAQAALPHVWDRVRQDAQTRAARGFAVACAKPAYLAVENGPVLTQHLFSIADDLNTEEIEWLPVSTGAGSGLEGRVRTVWDLADQRFPFDRRLLDLPVTPVAAPHLYLRNHVNFGHFVLDFLASLFTAEHLFPDLARLPIALNLRLDEHRILLNAFGIPDERLNLFQPPVGQRALYRFDELHVPSSGRGPLGCSLIAERAARAVPALPSHRRLFLSRRRFTPRHRIANQDEVEALLHERGFEALLPETLDPLDLLTQVRQAEMVALPFGAGLGNLAMTQPHCAIILMVPEFFAADRYDSALLSGQRRFLLPFFDRLWFVAGQPAPGVPPPIGADGRLSWNLGTLNEPYLYNLGALDLAILKAEKALRASAVKTGL